MKHVWGKIRHAFLTEGIEYSYKFLMKKISLYRRFVVETKVGIPTKARVFTSFFKTLQGDSKQSGTIIQYFPRD